MCPPAGRKTHGGVWLGPEVRGLSQLRFGHSSTELSPSPTQPEALWGKPSPLQLQKPAFSTSLQGSSHLPRGLRSPTRPRDKKEERKTGTGGQGLLRGPYRFPALQCPMLRGCKWQGPSNLKGNPMATAGGWKKGLEIRRKWEEGHC